MQNKVIILGGYSRSGKSTFLDVATGLGWTSLSTSRKLDELSYAVYLAVCLFLNEKPLDEEEFILALRNKDAELLGFDPRKFKITVAEDVVIPIFGRDIGIVNPVVEHLKNFLDRTTVGFVNKSEPKLAIVESIGGVEWELMVKNFFRLDILNKADIMVVNVRSKREEIGNDIRQLLPDGIELRNDGTLPEWKATVESFLSDVISDAIGGKYNG